MSNVAQQEASPADRYQVRRPSLPEAALDCWLRGSLSRQFDPVRNTSPSRELARLLERLGLAEMTGH